MTDPRPVAIVSAIVVAGLGTACGPQSVRTPERPGQAEIILLPDLDSKTVGRATVSNASGSATLETARQSTVVSAGAPPAPVTVLSQSDVDRIFGDALSALPLPPQRFTLYFRFESNELTDESRAMLPEIRKAITARPVPDLVVIGHTDTTGTRAANVALGRTRAMMVRALLVAAGLNPAVIDVASHGESDPLVQTADNTPEPRNRRVEISVR
jgi:outer membrane protein OmpA-like peptidoglycan-associated protein